MMRRALRGLFLSVILLVAVAGCSDSTTTTPTTPTTSIETFAGTLAVNGANTHPLAITVSGTVTATLMSVAPDAASVLGVSLGTWNGSYCSIVLAKDQSSVGSTVVGRVSGTGSLCLRVYDSGLLTQETSYEVQVSHP